MPESYNTKTIEYNNSLLVKRYAHNIKSGYKLSAADKDSRRRKSDKDSRTPQQIEHCLQSSVNRTKNTVYALALANNWEWFYTFTFDPAKVDSYNYDAVTKALKTWLDDTRRMYAPNMRYIIVPELHESGRYHFHGLFADVDKIPVVLGAGQSDIYNLPTYDYGYTTASKIKDSDSTCSYCLKYITKELCATTQNKKRYWRSRNLSKPRETTYNLSNEDFYEQLDNIDVVYTKTVDVPASHNRINIHIADM